MKKIKEALISFAVGFTAAFVGNAAVVYGWNYFIHNEASFNWPLAFSFGILLGVLCPFVTRLTAGNSVPSVTDK
jgi:hypothetical protein